MVTANSTSPKYAPNRTPARNHSIHCAGPARERSRRGEIPHHNEVHTLNHLVATYSHTWASGWGISANRPTVVE
jgi:hypothetical protein